MPTSKLLKSLKPSFEHTVIHDEMVSKLTKVDTDDRGKATGLPNIW